MKVLMIAPACDGEDVGEAWVAAQWARMISEVHDLTLLTTFKRGHTPMSQQLPGTKVVEWQEPPGVGRFERFNSLLQPGYLPFLIRARRWIRKHQGAEQYAVAHQVVPVAMRYPSPARGLGIPLVMGPVGGSLESPAAFVTEEGETPWWQRLRRLDRWRIQHDRALRATYEQAALVVGVAEYVRDFLAHVSIQRFEIMSEIAVDRLPELPEPTGQGGTVRLLHVGRIVRTKGLRDVIRALDTLRDLNVELDVVGDGNDRAACEQLVADLALADRVTFHGKVSRDRVDAFYSAADVFVFPSYREPGGSVVLEAMSYGLPLIVCRRGGPGANVTDECAIRLEAHNPDQLAADCADAVRTIVTDPTRRAAMSAASRRHAAEAHLWSSRLTQMTRYYDEVATQPREPS